MNSLRGLVVINPTLKYNRARTLAHSSGQRSPFTSLTGGKGQEGWGGPGLHEREFRMLLQLESFLSFFFFFLAELGS